ncbi:hypothetical protein ACHFJ0_00585 [Paracoccus sp. NGMCC 1.201697]|uniref:GNAT family N-acetyltransferase n=1 Tax=Paracoccus broussonetiae subsp. drimophilus TaxID=3373869 RepID=A0ABW7LEQ8_9RHOB
MPVLQDCEWLGDAGLADRFFAALDPAGSMVAVVGFTMKRHRLSDGGLTACLIRGCTTPGAHQHAASWLISRACRALRRDGVRKIIAYSDVLAGERGVIYRAAGFKLAEMKAKTRFRVRPPGIRWHQHGLCYSDRWLRHGGRNWSHATARANGFKVERIPQRQRWERHL